MRKPLQRKACTLSLFLVLTFVSTLLQLSTHAQSTGKRLYPRGNYISPMPMPIALSGSFGSIRSRHFHSGTDMRTASVEGEVVRAVAAGHVVRINVSTTGYGNCIYVQHEGGVMSVYGHLQAFAPYLEAYVVEQQYAHKKSEIELYPSVGTFPVSQADLLGWSGNTGSSGDRTVTLSCGRRTAPYLTIPIARVSPMRMLRRLLSRAYIFTVLTRRTTKPLLADVSSLHLVTTRGKNAFVCPIRLLYPVWWGWASK